MTTEQFKSKIQALLSDDSGIATVIENACLGVAAQRSIQARRLNAAEDDFIFPKQVLCAVLQQLAWQYEPNNNAGQKVTKEIKTVVNFYTPHP